MSPISAADVSALRARTGVSILACKEALEKAGGDQEKAIEILRKRGIAQAVKKAAREQHEGAIFIASNGNKAGIVSLRCETDFVARGDAFISLGDDLAKILLEKGLAACRSEAEKSIPEAVQKLGENISMSDQEVDAPVIGSYVHSNRKIAVVIGLEQGTSDMAKDVAMHATAMNPLYLYPEDVPEDVLAKEREIWKEQMKNENKPAAILEKIMLGKERKFREENALTKQAFVKDSTKTIEQFIQNAKVLSYVRVVI